MQPAYMLAIKWRLLEHLMCSLCLRPCGKHRRMQQPCRSFLTSWDKQQVDRILQVPPAAPVAWRLSLTQPSASAA